MSACDQLLTAYYQVAIAFCVFAVAAGVGVGLLLAQVLHLNDVIRDLQNEIEYLEDMLKEAVPPVRKDHRADAAADAFCVGEADQ